MILDILVNGQRVDVLDRSSINLRMNNVIYNPTEINNTQAEYSFSFNLPTTPNNNKIFDYANVLSKINKFQNIYNCEVYSDEVLIFNGSLRIQSIKKGFYNVNLINIKINTVDEIFGDMKLNEVDWKIPFTGIGSINTYNANANSKVIFPLVSYGVFQKKPSSTSYDYNNYTSKFQIDKYNKWYYESFNPSPNLLELIRRLFAQKGYTVSGNIFQDRAMNNIYMSTNLSDNQIPTYNLGHPNMGQAKITTEFSNYVDKNTGQSNGASFIEHNLSYPYQKHGARDAGDNWNWPTIDIYDLWSSSNSKITRQSEHYLFDDFSNCIVIPADGLYKVKIDVNVSLPSQTMQALQWWTPDRGRDPEEHLITINNDLRDDMPIEIQLVRNEDECELIHGSLQWGYTNGDRNMRYEWNTAYPHENLYSASNPTVSVTQYAATNSGRYSSSTGGRRYSSVRTETRATRPSTGSRPSRPTGSSMRGYMPKAGELLAYDPWVNENFIAGISSIGNGTPSVIKNGYSWNAGVADKFNSRYQTNGYWKLTSEGRTNPTYTWEQTEFNKNQLIDSPSNTITLSQRSMTGSVSGIVELKRNDILMLKALARHWYNETRDIYYKFDCTVTVEIEAYSPMSIETMETQNRGWNSPSQFDVDLQVGNFFNKETKVSDFINNFLKEFNLQYVNEGKAVYINTQRLDIDNPKYAVNLDDRVEEGESQLIDYPSYLVTKYKIDTEEWGFETTVPPDKLNDPNWKDYGDYGYDKVIINDSSNDTGEEVQLTTSYCWYDDFKILNDEDEEIGVINIPVISKFSYMIDGYSYEDSMKVDGKGLPLRYWYRGRDTGFSVLVNGKYPVNIYNTVNAYDGLTLSYHNVDGTLLTKYFNLNPDLSSNYVSVKCYLNASEYTLLKGGANVIFDSDLYIVSEIQGYDANGINQTELLLIKKK